MSLIKEVVVRFKPGTATDIVSHRIRVRPANTVAAYDTPFDDVAAATPDADGFCRIPAANVPSMVGLSGQFDVHITEVDARGNESDFLEIDNQTFDLSPPDAPTEGSLE